MDEQTTMNPETLDAESERRVVSLRDALTGPPPPVGTIAKALAEAQGEIKTPKKTKTAKVATKQGPDYSYDYASLDDVIAAVSDVFPRHGLAFVQDATTRQSVVSVTTIVYHESGESLRFGPFELPVGVATPQGYGSALTYARRYALCAALGIAAEADDDAKLASGSPSGARAASKLSEKQMRGLHATANDRGVTHEQLRDWAGTNLGIESLRELTPTGAKKVNDWLATLPTVTKTKTETTNESAPTDDRADHAALLADAKKLAGGPKKLLDWYRDEFQIEGAVSTRDLTTEKLRRLVDVMRQTLGVAEDRGAESGETSAADPPA